MEKLRPKTIPEPTKADLDKIESEAINYKFDFSAIEKVDIDNPLGLYLASLPKVKFNTLQEDLDLGYRIRNNENPEEAKEALFYSVARMVVAEAAKSKTSKVSVMDLIQEGNLAVFANAIKKYNPDQKVKFSTYAMYWIQQAMIRGTVKLGTTDIVSERTHFESRKLERYFFDHLAETGKELTVDELSDKSGLSPTVVKLRQDFAKMKRLSAYSPHYDSPNEEMIESFTDNNAAYRNGLEDQINFKDSLKKLAEEINALPLRDAKILRMRLGIDQDGNITHKRLGHKDIAKKLGISHETIRVYQDRALAKFKDRELRKQVYGILHQRLPITKVHV